MKYKGYTGSVDEIRLFRHRAVKWGKGKNHFKDAELINVLGMTITKLNPNPTTASSTSQIYFTLPKARQIANRMAKLLNELVKAEDKRLQRKKRRKRK